MSASIEWGHARSVSTYMLGHDEEAGDHQTIAEDSDNPEEVGLMLDCGGDGFCLVGTPVELLKALGKAMDDVLQHIKNTHQ